jgi:hydroxymethylbilane synthase
VSRTLVLGTRGSALALAQTRIVSDALGGSVETRVIRTTGDASSRPLHELGDGVFVTAIEDALRSGEIDAAVHSLKDLPTGERPGLVIAAILPREDPRDVLITSARGGLATLPHGARVGTSSPRRDAALRRLRPDITTAPIRGNVETRLAKVVRGEYDATVLALAGFLRLGVVVGDDEILPADQMLPAPGQGAIAVQCRADDPLTRDRLATIDDAATRAATDAERELLRLMGGSCELALGALATRSGDDVVLDASIDGRRTRVRGRDPMAAARNAAAELGALDAV